MRQFTLLIALLLSLSPLAHAKKAKEGETQQRVKRSERIAVTDDHYVMFEEGDISTFQRWIEANVKYPSKAIKEKITGKVLLDCLVDETGKISITEVIESPDMSFTYEAQQVIKAAPLLTPAMKSGKAIATRIYLPIYFTINGQLDRVTDSGVERLETLYTINEMATLADGRPLIELHDWVMSQVDHPAMLRNSTQKGEVQYSFVIERDSTMKEVKVRADDPTLRVMLEGILARAPKVLPARIGGEAVRYRSLTALSIRRMRNWQTESMTRKAKEAIERGEPITLDCVQTLPTYEGQSINHYLDILVKKCYDLVPPTQGHPINTVNVNLTLSRDGKINVTYISDESPKAYQNALRKAISSIENRWHCAQLYNHNVSVTILLKIPFR